MGLYYNSTDSYYIYLIAQKAFVDLPKEINVHTLLWLKVNESRQSQIALNI